MRVRDKEGTSEKKRRKGFPSSHHLCGAVMNAGECSNATASFKLSWWMSIRGRIFMRLMRELAVTGTQNATKDQYTVTVPSENFPSGCIDKWHHREKLL